MRRFLTNFVNARYLAADGGGGGSATLSPAQVEQLVDGLKRSNENLTAGRQAMDDCNRKVGELLTKQTAIEKAVGGPNGEAIAKIQSDLTGLADRMEGLAQQHTNLSRAVTQGLKALGSDGAAEDTAYVYRGPNSRGTIWESKRQALEVGMYFMATMRRQTPARAYARQWLKDQKQDLRYLPQIPSSFVQDLGQEWVQSMNNIVFGKQWAQDLSGSATPGSVLVRPEFANILIRNVELHGRFRQNALVWPMGSDTVWIPRRVSGLSVYWEGEGEAASTTDPVFDLPSMTAKKMLMLHKWSSELDQDAAFALADIIMFEFSLAIALEEDRIGFNGDGSGGNSPSFAGFFGVLGSPNTAAFDVQLVTGAAGDNLTTEIKLPKLRAMTGLLPTWARANAKWYMNKTVLADLDAIEYSTGGPVVKYQDGRSASILGYPVVEVDQMPVSPSAASTKVLALGDLRASWYLGDRRAAELETSEHYAFNTDQLTARMKARIAYLRAQGNGMVAYKTGTA